MASTHSRLITLLCLSALVHGACFYALKVYYTPPASLPPPPLHWTVLPPSDPASITINRWLDVADPIWTVRAPAQSSAGVVASLEFAYVPSFMSGPGLLSMRAASPSPKFDALATPPVVHSVLAREADLPPRRLPSPAAYPARTAVSLSKEIEDRLSQDESPAPLHVATHAASVNDLLNAAVFSVGVRVEGGHPVLFTETSSGNTKCDDLARAYLARLTFRPQAGGRIVWGKAVVYWGRDAYD